MWERVFTLRVCWAMSGSSRGQGRTQALRGFRNVSLVRSWSEGLEVKRGIIESEYTDQAAEFNKGKSRNSRLLSYIVCRTHENRHLCLGKVAQIGALPTHLTSKPASQCQTWSGPGSGTRKSVLRNILLAFIVTSSIKARSKHLVGWPTHVQTVCVVMHADNDTSKTWSGCLFWSDRRQLIWSCAFSYFRCSESRRHQTVVEHGCVYFWLCVCLISHRSAFWECSPLIGQTHN